MGVLAINGGKAVTGELMGKTQLVTRKDLERTYLLEVFDRGPQDDWPGVESMAALFGREFAEFHGARYCALVTNGTHSLQLALESLDIGFGDEVIVPGLTWQATASVVCDVNAVPVFVDVDPETLCIDTTKIEAAVTPRTRAIIAVHLYHRMADMDRVLDIARRHSLQVVVDSAHSHGSQWDGKGCGSQGAFASFSFQSSKQMASAEGGALTTNDENLYWKVVSQRACGREFNGVKLHSGNYRITSYQAALLRGQLEAMKTNAPVIDRNGLALDKAVAAAPGVRPLRRNAHITRQTGYNYVFLYEPKEFDGLPGESFRRALSAELGWEFATTYTPLHHSEVYSPHTKKRHNLGRDYLAAITPSRWQIPAAEALWKDRAVTSFWTLYGLAPERAHLLTDAIAKIHKNRGELLGVRK